MKSFILIVVVFGSVAVAATQKPLKILVEQIGPSPSQIQFSGALVNALTERGHIVDKVLRVFNPLITTNGTTKARNVYRFVPQKHRPVPFGKVGHTNVRLDKIKVLPYDKLMVETNYILCEDLIDDNELIEKLRSEKYDVGLTAAYTGCGTGLFHLIGIKSTHTYLPVASYDGVYQALGIPVPSSYVPGVFLDNAKSTSQSFLERLYSFYHHWTLQRITKETIDKENLIFQKRFPNFPDLFQLYQSNAYFFQNTDDILDFQHPISAKIKNIGGIAIKEPKAISEEFDHILSERANGAIIFSIGTLLRTSQIPIQIQWGLVNAFRHFDQYTFIWKHNDAESARTLFQNITNVKFVDWMPQNDLLHDTRVRLIISHMGSNSYLEAMKAGKPVIGCPLMGDQFYNSGAAVTNGLGVQIMPTDLNEENMKAAIHEVLDKQHYSENAQEVQRMLQRKPITAKENFIQLIEYAAEHPTLGSKLSLAAKDITFATYFGLDIAAFLLSVSIFFLLCISALLSQIPRIIKKKFKSE